MGNEYILEVKNVVRTFPGVQALRKVNLFVRRGTIHGLVGENGAGKSTLMKIVIGADRLDSGEIVFEGQKIHLSSVHEARNLGIGIVYQERSLFPHQLVVDNVYAGRELSKGIFVDKKKMIDETKKLLGCFGINMSISPTEKVSDLPVAMQQIVEIAKALSIKMKLLILDEPTAALTRFETEKLFEIIRNLVKRNGLTVIFISHHLEEIMEFAEFVSIFRDGKDIAHRKVSQLTGRQIIELMTGKKLGEIAVEKEHVKSLKNILEINDLISKYFKNITFRVKKGEVVGLTGLVGSGRSEVAKSIFGQLSFDSGEIKLSGKKIKIDSPKTAIKNKICYLPPDRKAEGLFLDMSVKDNISVSIFNEITKYGFLVGHQCTKIVQSAIDKINIMTPSMNQKVMYLSGGNQQKVLLSRWLITKPKLLILDEPTFGVDIGAKFEIHKLIRALTEKGVSIIVCSSDQREILTVCDRILVFYKGKITHELSPSDVTRDELLALTLGIKT